jgi:hypothetical protein
VKRNSDLMQIVLARRPCSGFAHLLDGWQKQTDKYGNDGNHHEQFNKSKTPTFTQASSRHEKSSKGINKRPRSLTGIERGIERDIAIYATTPHRHF